MDQFVETDVSQSAMTDARMMKIAAENFDALKAVTQNMLPGVNSTRGSSVLILARNVKTILYIYICT